MNLVRFAPQAGKARRPEFAWSVRRLESKDGQALAKEGESMSTNRNIRLDLA